MQTAQSGSPVDLNAAVDNILSSEGAPADSECSEAEREARIELAAAYRLFDWLGITDIIHTHISLRVPGRHDQFLLLPYGILFAEARASHMVKCDTQGKIISDPTGLGISVGGFCIHSAIHMGRDDAACVMHAHSEATIAVGNMRAGLLPLSQHALRFYNRIAYLDYCGMFNSDEKRAQLPEALGNAQVLMLRNHGPLVIASTPWECFSRMYYLERACRMQVAMLSSVRDPQTELCWPDADSCEGMARAFEDPSQKVVKREWTALRRMLDRQDVSYRD
jgi:ribulose-5-phosphate 4-epimerase/fuculose-1-phosphate aldolase